MRAIFRGGELEGKPCIIRDFCPGGFFLSWSDESSGSEILAIKDSLPEENFSVDFKVKLKNSGEKAYSISFKVIRVFQGGMGVSFNDPDQDVVDILVKIADATQKKKQAESEKKRDLIRPDDQTSHFNKSFQGQMKIENQLDDILRTYFKKYDNKLIVLFKETQDETEKFEYFNAQEIIKNDPVAPKIEVLKAVSAQLEERPSLKWEKTYDEAVDGNSLTLVDEKEFEAYLILTGIISDAEADNRLLLFRVAKKLSELFDTDWDEGLNPLGFSRLFRTIDSYLQHKTFSYTALKIAYQQMNEVLVPEMIAFYEELSEGVEASPAGKTEDSFGDKKESSASANLDDKVEQQTTGQSTDVSVQNSVAGSSTANSGQGLSQPSGFQPNHQTGNDNGFPSLETNNSPPTSVTRGAGGLAQTLMALQNSVGVPGALHNMFQGQADQGVSVSGSHSLDGMSGDGMSGGGMSGGGMSGGGMSGGGMSGGGMSGGGMSGGGMSGGGMSGGGMSGGGMSGATIPEGQQQNILQFLDKIQQEDDLKWQNGETIGDVTGRLNPMLFGAQEQISGEAKNALNLAGGVLNFLKDDQYLSSPARQNLQRMQTVLYKQAVSDEGLFQERSNPLRNIINLLEQLDLKGGNNQPETRQALDDIVGKILSQESYDAESLDHVTESLNDLLVQHNNAYDQRVEKVSEQCDLEQTMLDDLRKDEDVDLVRRQAQQAGKSGEYKVWQDRAKAMNRGDSIVVDDGNGDKNHLSLAWTNPDSSRFVFVDGEGEKAANMTQQELIVRLLKGTAELTDENQKPLFDRAIISSLFDAYDEVKEQIIHDPETGLLNEEKYRTELKLVIENAISDHVEHIFFYLALTEENIDSDKLIAYLKHVSDLSSEVFGEQSLTGRLGEKSLGVTSEFMSREGALILAETLFKSLEDNVCEVNNETINYPVSIGITIINDQSSEVDETILQASAASKKASELGDNQSWLHEEIVLDTETDHESIDWQFWLEDYSQPEEVIPLFGQSLVINSDDSVKPLFHLYPAEKDDEGNIRSPARFIKASSDDVLVSEFEKQFVKNCLQWMAGNKKILSASSRCLISLSGKTINNKGTLDFVIEKLTEFAVPPGKICFEVPGSPADNEKANIKRFIRTLSEFGCRFSLGQYGSDGLSQEAMKLPADYICIDEILTSDVVESAQSYGLIKSINDIAHMMDKQTIVPHRVDDGTMELLREMNIDYISSNATEDLERLNPVQTEM